MPKAPPVKRPPSAAPTNTGPASDDLRREMATMLDQEEQSTLKQQGIDGSDLPPPVGADRAPQDPPQDPPGGPPQDPPSGTELFTDFTPGAPPPADPPAPPPADGPQDPPADDPNKPKPTPQEINFAAFKRKSEAREQELLRRIQQLENDNPAVTQLQRDLDAERTLRNEVQAELGKVNIRKHPRFLAQFEEPNKEVRRLAKQAGQQFGLDEKQVDALFDLDPKAQQEALAKIPDARPVLERFLTDYTIRKMQGDDFANRHFQSLSQLDADHAEEQRRSVQRAQLTLKNLVVKTASDLAKTGLAGFNIQPGEETVVADAIRDLLEDAGRQIFGADDAPRVQLMLKGATVPRYEALLKTKDARIAELEETLAQYDRSVPRTRGNSDRAPAAPDKTMENLDPSNQWDTALRRRRAPGS